jgi:uroporphyrinogen decarboxylase
MKPRERVKKALSHKEPDRVPIDLGGPQSTIEVIAYRNLVEFLKIESKYEVFLRAHIIPDEEVLDLFKVDTRYVYFREPEKWDPDKYTGEGYLDEWGKKWKLSRGNLYVELVNSPLQNSSADIDAINKYKWPVNTIKRDIVRWKNQAKNLYKNSDFFIIGDSIGWGIFEESWGVRGLENFLIDLVSNTKFADALLNKILETQISRLEPYLEAIGPYIGAICMSDDITGQTGPIISPYLYRKMIKPKHKELINFIKSKTNALIFFHCCGNVIPFLGDFIDIGADIINPIQVSAGEMDDTKKLKERYGDKIVFWGGGCDFNILPNGARNKIDKEVKRRIEDLSPGGGYVFAPIHNIQPDVPAENIVTLYESGFKYGRY